MDVYLCVWQYSITYLVHLQRRKRNLLISADSICTSIATTDSAATLHNKQLVLLLAAVDDDTHFLKCKMYGNVMCPFLPRYIYISFHFPQKGKKRKFSWFSIHVLYVLHGIHKFTGYFPSGSGFVGSTYFQLDLCKWFCTVYWYATHVCLHLASFLFFQG